MGRGQLGEGGLHLFWRRIFADQTLLSHGGQYEMVLDRGAQQGRLAFDRRGLTHSARIFGQELHEFIDGDGRTANPRHDYGFHIGNCHRLT
jgi:hypothetical protein